MKRQRKDGEGSSGMAPPPKKAKAKTAAKSTVMFGKNKDLAAFKKKQLTKKVRELRNEINRLEAANESLQSAKATAVGGLSALSRAWDQLDREVTRALVASGAAPSSAADDLDAAIAARKDAGGTDALQRVAPVPLALAGSESEDPESAAAAALTAAVGDRITRSAEALSLLVSTGATGSVGGEARVAAAEAAARRHEASADAHNDAIAALEAKLLEMRNERDAALEDLRIETNKTGKLRDAEAELQASLAETRDELDTARDEIRKFKTRASSSTVTVGGVGSSPASSAQVAELEEQVKQFKALAEAREADVIALKEKRIEALTTVGKLEAQVAGILTPDVLKSSPMFLHMQHREPELLAEIDQLKKELAAAQASNEELAQLAAGADAAARAALQQTLEEALGSAKRADSLASRYRQERDDLALRLKKAEAARAGTDTKREMYDRLCQSLDARISEMSAAAASASASADTASQVAAKSEAELRALSLDELVQHVAAFAPAAASAGALGPQLEALAKALAAAEADSTRLSKQVSDLSSRLAAAEAARADANVVSATAKQERALLTKKIGRLQDKAAAQSEVIAKLEAADAAGRTALEQVRAASTRLENELTTAKRIARTATQAQQAAGAEAAQATKALTAAQTKAAKLEVQLEDKVAELKTAETKTKQLARKFKKANASRSSISGTGDVAVLAEEVDMLRGLVNCSVCETRTKDCIITRCSHAFCRVCIDANLAARNRKCPGCGQAYHKDDVQSMYL
ncbi:uncharacterized protein AMSG_01397 [Thecamonas trahens ATCC 50062]|uniref:E3 ubiquitin protein ligase n=1 Tax=Thecamonas trahens ATCC 50062 TaxID=461836 RepID=A0A0L0DNU9_THETB|nr:hypothetical protein AMSG_01397 [Thecamonas trahens ATCC 50062]KNC53686.1 hypothetical protein AMSG_01397 [Thecamonas trahens ATCC 50062]|eukprot:XP_013762000.1 hypothetical protein AMSG_01397 [Thecamonas trahens ATCC 50062]